MSWTWLTGKIQLEHLKHRHARWYKQLTESSPSKSNGIGSAEQTEIKVTEHK
jgi:hypothetical protein